MNGSGTSRAAITSTEALSIVLREARPLAPRRLPLSRALGRVLAQDIRAGGDDPPWDNSAMDGYGVRHRDLKGAREDAPVKLKLAGTLMAGRTSARVLRPGEALGIMTGAPVPRGVTAVIPVERAREEGGAVLAFTEVAPGENIRRRGENVRAGEKVLVRGRRLGPPEIGMLAIVGRGRVKVIPAPRVAVLATGDELVGVDRKPPRGKIRDANSHSLAAAVRAGGAEPVLLGIARDRPGHLAARMRRGLEADALIVSGGISVGKADYVRSVGEKLGIRFRFGRILQRPGQPFTFGTHRRRPVFCVPGNVVSTLVVFEIYIRPALLKMAGISGAGRPEVPAVMDEPVRVKPGKRHFLRVELTRRGGRYHAALAGSQGAGILKSLVRADGLLVVPEHVGRIGKGETWPVRLIRES